MSVLKKLIPPGWVEVELSEISLINPPLNRCILNDSIVVDFVPMRAVEPDGGGLLRPESKTFGTVKKGFTSFLAGDVIMAKITPCMENGKTCVVPELPGAACFGSTEFHVVRNENGIEARWIANFLLQHSTRHLAQRQMMGGVGQMRVPASFLSTLKIPVPPIQEQKRILEVTDEMISDLDTGLASLERVQVKLKHYRTTVLKSALEGALTFGWRKKQATVEPASALLTRILIERRRRWEIVQLQKFKENGKTPPKGWKEKYQEPEGIGLSNLSDLPKGWCWVTFEQISSFVTSGSRGWAEYYSEKGPLFVRSQDISSDKLQLDDVAHVSPPVSSEGARTRLQRGDFLVTITGANVAKAAWVKTDLDEAYVSQHVGLIRLVDPDSGPFLHSYVTAPTGGRKLLLGAAYGAGKPGLNLDNLRELPIPFPPLAEQKAIVEAVEEQLSMIDHLEADIAAKLASAQALRQSILRHAFTGQLVPQDPNDEPASELLKRIAAEREERMRQAKAVKGKAAKPVPKKQSKKVVKIAAKVPAKAPTKRPRVKTAA